MSRHPEFLNFLEGNEVDENDIAILQFIVQTNLARYNGQSLVLSLMICVYVCGCV